MKSSAPARVDIHHLPFAVICWTKLVIFRERTTGVDREIIACNGKPALTGSMSA